MSCTVVVATLHRYENQDQESTKSKCSLVHIFRLHKQDFTNYSVPLLISLDFTVIAPARVSVLAMTSGWSRDMQK